MVDNWTNLEYLNLSNNQLSSLPSAFCKLTLLRKLYLHDNKLTFSSIPGGMGKLQALEIFHAARNQLENIPEGLCRCGKLKKLILTSNRLVSVTCSGHFLEKRHKMTSQKISKLAPTTPLNVKLCIITWDGRR